MEIMSLKLKSKTNSNIFVATTSDGEFLLHSDIIVSNGIVKGEVDDKAFVEAVKDSEVLIATATIMKYLGSHLKTERGIRDYLKKKSFSEYAINETVKKLLEYNIVDDKTYAESYIKSNPNFSKRKLKEKLKQSGVNRELVEELTEDIDETNACEKSIRKYLKGKVLDKQTKEKLFRRLCGMGYNFDTINSTIKKFEREE